MSDRPPWDITATGADEKIAAGAAAQVVRRMIVVSLLTAAALDLTWCGLVMTAARHPAPTAGLVAAGLGAATFTARTARGCQTG
jgi:predicted small integral membrane protein